MREERVLYLSELQEFIKTLPIEKIERISNVASLDKEKRNSDSYKFMKREFSTVDVWFGKNVLSISRIGRTKQLKIIDDINDGLFADFINLRDISGLSNWDVSGVTSFNRWFCNDVKINIDTIKNWNIPNLESIDIENIFKGTNLTATDVLKFLTGSSTKDTKSEQEKAETKPPVKKKTTIKKAVKKEDHVIKEKETVKEKTIPFDIDKMYDKDNTSESIICIILKILNHNHWDNGKTVQDVDILESLKHIAANPAYSNLNMLSVILNLYSVNGKLSSQINMIDTEFKNLTRYVIIYQKTGSKLLGTLPEYKVIVKNTINDCDEFVFKTFNPKFISIEFIKKKFNVRPFAIFSVDEYMLVSEK